MLTAGSLVVSRGSTELTGCSICDIRSSPPAVASRSSGVACLHLYLEIKWYWGHVFLPFIVMGLMVRVGLVLDRIIVVATLVDGSHVQEFRERSKRHGFVKRRMYGYTRGMELRK